MVSDIGLCSGGGRKRSIPLINKRVTNTAKSILSLWNTGLFALVWCFFYNNYVFDTFRVKGGIITLIIYSFIYHSLCNLYKAHRIASSEIGATVFSQVLSFGIADLIMYTECCLVYNRYVNILPGMAAVAGQILGTAGIVTLTKQYFIRFIPARATLLYYGKQVELQDVVQFQERLMKKYSHLFEIKALECEGEKDFEAACALYDTVILYEISGENRGRYMAFLAEWQKTFYLTPTVEDIMMQGCEPKHLLDTPLMKYDYKYDRRRSLYLKRILDIVFSIVILVLLSPVLLIVAAMIRLEDGGPVFFRQKRCTKDAREFDILKFRSMIVDAEKQGVTPCGKGDSRITRVGKVIRRFRLDEVPQFINVLKGDMSIVGPRPERVEHVRHYIHEVPEFAYRMRVLGGLTGYAQIYGKYNTSAYDKLRLDLLYIENQSMVLDLKLMLLTIKTIFTLESTEGFTSEKSEKIRKESRKIRLRKLKA